MFEVPKSQINLMNDYKEWIEKALIKKPPHQNLWVNGGSGSLLRA